jgi:hypothetical protein
LRSGFLLAFSVVDVFCFFFCFLSESHFVTLYLRTDRSYAGFRQLVAKMMPDSKIPPQQTISNWATQANIATNVVARQGSRGMIERADTELATLLRRLRARGCALHLREVIALRAAQLVHDPNLALACMSYRHKSKTNVADRAVVAAGRAGIRDAAQIAAAEAHAVAESEARRQSVFMSESWASRFLKENKFSLRRVTSGKIAESHDQIRLQNQLTRVAQAIAEMHIPSSAWIFNMDESGYILAKASDTTFADRGAHDAAVNGHSQREQVTVVETVSMQGELLPRQVIFGGATSAVFPPARDGMFYAFSKSHWANKDTIIQWFDDVMLPHLSKLRSSPNHKHQHALLLLDAYSAHFNEAFLRHAARSGVRVIQIEPCYTSLLQPCDHQCGPNRNIKPIVYRLNDYAYLKSVVASMKRNADTRAVAEALDKFNSTPYNFKLVDKDDSMVVVE